jgi:hypothetical protein
VTAFRGLLGESDNGSNPPAAMGIRFFVPGTTTAATVKGFGAVFTDVDGGGTTKLEFLDQSGKVIFVTFALAA